MKISQSVMIKFSLFKNFRMRSGVVSYVFYLFCVLSVPSRKVGYWREGSFVLFPAVWNEWEKPKNPLLEKNLQDIILSNLLS